MKKGMLILSGVLGLSLIALVLLIMVYIGKNEIARNNSGSDGTEQTAEHTDEQESSTRAAVTLVTLPKDIELPDWAEEFKTTIMEDYLPVNEYSRPGKELKKVNAVVIHYVGNPGTTAAQNRSYFENIIETGEAYVSSHFIVGLDGEIIQCVPLDEISYASNERNDDTIAVESCHPDETGAYNKATYESLVKLTAYLCILYNLNPDKDIIRHYDVTRKICPRYFVNHKSHWEQFKLDCYNYLNGLVKEKDIVNCTNGKGKVTVIPDATQNKTQYVRILQDVNIRSAADFTDASVIGVVKKGGVYTVVEKIERTGTDMYKLKSGVYITASPKYVEVFEK